MRLKNKLFIFLGLLTFIVLPGNVFAFELPIDTSSNGVINVEIEPSDTVGNLREKIYNRLSVPINAQNLIFDNKLLIDNSKSMADLNINQHSTVYLRNTFIIVSDEVLYDMHTTNVNNTASYDLVSNTLTLDNYGNDEIYGSIIYYGRIELNVVLKNDNKIYVGNNNCGLLSKESNMIITGSGKLSVFGGKSGISASSGKIEINNTNILLSDVDSGGILAYKDIIINGNSNVEVVTRVYGILATENFIMNSGKLKVESANFGIASRKNIEFNGGEAEIVAGEKNSGVALLVLYGDDANHKLSIADNLYYEPNDATVQNANVLLSANPAKTLTMGYEGASLSAATTFDTPNVLHKIVIKPKYKVTFNTNGGSAINNQLVSPNAKALTPDVPTKEGYKFIGWYTTEDLTTEYNFDSNVTSDITLYAKWEKIYKNPKTGDNILSVLGLSIVSILVLSLSSLSLRKQN